MRRLEDLRHSRHEVRDVRALVSLHHRIHDHEGDWTAPAVRAVLVDTGERLDELVVLSRANASARALLSASSFAAASAASPDRR